MAKAIAKDRTALGQKERKVKKQKKKRQRKIKRYDLRYDLGLTVSLIFSNKDKDMKHPLVFVSEIKWERQKR